MRRTRRRYTAKTKGRTFIFTMLFLFIILTLFYTLVSDLQKISMLNIEKAELKRKKIILKNDEESLESDIIRLSDDYYVARFAREKYYYSKDNEIILKME